MTDIQKLLRDAVEKAGSQAKFAEAVGLSQQGVSYLLRNSDRIAAETAIAIERATNGEIRREQLRPDLFGNAA